LSSIGTIINHTSTANRQVDVLDFRTRQGREHPGPPVPERNADHDAQPDP
jgi:hypothetical protein